MKYKEKHRLLLEKISADKSDDANFYSNIVSEGFDEFRKVFSDIMKQSIDPDIVLGRKEPAEYDLNKAQNYAREINKICEEYNIEKMFETDIENKVELQIEIFGIADDFFKNRY